MSIYVDTETRVLTVLRREKRVRQTPLQLTFDKVQTYTLHGRQFVLRVYYTRLKAVMVH
mgnify:CR=1 FL=1